MTSARILFIVDAGPEVGGGHVMRSLTLARALEEKGASFAFLAPPEVGAILEAFAPDVPRLPVASTTPKALMGGLVAQLFDAFVFDHYRLSYADQRGMAGSRPALVIDDLADRPLNADLILDSGPARRASDYEGLHDGARLLLGPAYAPVRPEFAQFRERALARRGQPVRRIMVSMGLTDVGGATSRVVERLRFRAGDLPLDIVLGAEAPSLGGLTRVARRDPRLVLHVDAQDMGKLTLAADIAIGAAGSSMWERCVLGLPSLVVILAENQRAAAAALVERGAVLAVDASADDFEAQFDRALMRLLTDAELRMALAAASAQVCDGRGAERVAEAFLRLIAERTPA